MEQEAVFFERCDCLPSCSPSYTPIFAIATVIYVVYNLPKTKVVYKIIGLIGTVIRHLEIKVSRSRNMKQKIYEILTSPEIQTNGITYPEQLYR